VAIQDFDLSPSDTQVQPDDILVAQAQAPAAPAAAAAPATVIIEVSEGNVLRLPEGASIESPRINGTNLEFVQPDGTVIVVPNGAITGLIVDIGGAEIPAETVAALFDANGIETAAGPEGPTAPPSSGGNFAKASPGIGDGLPLIDLLPPTDFGFGPPELEELASGETRRSAVARPDFEPLIRSSENATVDEDGFDYANSDVPTNNEIVSTGSLIDTKTIVIDYQSAADVPTTLDGSLVLLDDDALDLQLVTLAGNPVTFALEAGALVGRDSVTSDVVIRIAVQPAPTLSGTEVTYSYVVTLSEPVKHPTLDGGPEDDSENFTLLSGVRFEAVDSDGDPVQGTVDVRIFDDIPVAGESDEEINQVDEDSLGDGNNGDAVQAIATGSIAGLVSFGADQPGSFSFTTGAVTALVGLGLTSGGLALNYDVTGGLLTAYTGADKSIGQVFTLQLDSNGDYTFTLLDQLDHETPDVDGDDQLLGLDFTGVIEATDSDGDSLPLTGSFIINVEDDIPVAGESDEEINQVDEDSLGDGNNGDAVQAIATGSIAGLVSFGADQPGSFSFTTGAVTALVGLGLTSGGLALNYDVTGGLLTAYTGADKSIGQVFTLQLDSNGDYTFTLLDQLDHETPDVDGDDQLLGLDFTGVIEATDSDGDSLPLTGSFIINVEDDIPVAGESDEEINQVDEDSLGDGNNGDAVQAIATGSIAGLVSFGADQPGSFSFTTGAVTALVGLGLTSGGLALNYDVTGGLLTAYTGADKSIGQVFTLQLDSNGDYTFTLLDQLDHETPDVDGDDQLLGLDFTGVIEATDSDGDSLPLTGSFIINVEDDIPVAGESDEEINQVDEDSLGDGNNGDAVQAIATGSIAGLVSFGADQPGSFSFTTGAVTALVGLGLTSGGLALNYDVTGGLLTAYTGADKSIGQVFTLQLDSNGDYTFTLLDQLDHETPDVDGDDQLLGLDFTGVIEATDSDGDSLPLTGSFIINVEDDIPVAGESDEEINQVDEDSLGDGNNGDAVQAIATGSIAGLVSFGADQPGSFSFTTGAVTALVGLGLTSGGLALNYDVTGGLLTAYTGADKSIGQVFTLQLDSNGDYTFTLLDQLDHETPDVDGDDQLLGLDFTGVIEATDSDGDSLPLTGSFIINVEDDIPVAGESDEEINQVDEDSLGDGNNGDAVQAIATGSIAGLVSFGADQPGSFSFTTGAVTALVGLGLTSGGLALNYDVTGGLLTAYTGADKSIGQVFTLQLDSNGDYTFTLLDQLDHETPDVDGDDQLLGLDFTGVIEATDSDGDSLPLTGSFIINVEDDIPVAGESDEEINQVDEDSLGDGNNGDAVQAIATGSIAGLVSFGADQPGSFSFTTGAVTALVGLGLTSGGLALNYDVTGGLLTAYTGADKSIGQVFTLQLDSNGDYTFTLLDQLDHETPDVDGDDQLLGLDFTGVIEATDSDGDSLPLTGSFIINVEDDIPVAGESDEEINQVDEDSLGDGNNGDAVQAIATGSIAGLVSFGADQPGSFSFTTGAVTALVGLGLTSGGLALNYDVTGGLLTAYTGADKSIGQVFTLQLDSNGDYTFTLLDQLDHETPDVDGDDQLLGLDFTGVIEATDSDGDSLPLTGSFIINVEDDIPVAGESDEEINQVDEDSLGDGNNGDAVQAIATGSIAGLVSFGADQPGSFSFTTGAVTALVGLGLTSGGLALNYDVTGGLLTAYTGADKSIGQVFTLQLDSNGDYTFTLLDQLDHETPDVDGDDQLLGLDFTGVIEATDSDGDSLPLTGSFIINVEDDIPVGIAPEMAVLLNSADATFTGLLDWDGNVDDNVGADDTGTISFANIANGDVATGAPQGSGAPLTSGGAPIYLYFGSNGTDPSVLIASTVTPAEWDSGAGINPASETVFTVTLDHNTSGDDTYTVDIVSTVDNGAGVSFANLSGTGNAGNPPFKIIDSTTADNLQTLFTPINANTVNSDQDDIGVGGQFIDIATPDKGLRVDFGQFIYHANGGGSSDDGFTISGHQLVNGFRFSIDQVSGGTTADVHLKTYDANEGAANQTIAAHNFGDDSPVTITEVAIYNELGALVGTAGSDVNFGSIGVDFLGDGTVLVTGLLADYSVLTRTASGYDRIEILNAGTTGGGSTDGKFSLSNLQLETVTTGDPVSLSFDLALTDADGDRTTSNVDIHLLPQAPTTLMAADGDTGTDALNPYTLAANEQHFLASADDDGDDGDYVSGNAENNVLATGDGDDFLSGGDGDDILIGGDGEDILIGGDGEDVLVGGFGQDTLNGGNDADTFVLDNFDASDFIVDYNDGQGDRIDLTALFDAGSGNLADFVQYDEGTGVLSVDVDGTGVGTAVAVATLQNTPTTITILFTADGVVTEGDLG
jgi:T1SS-143 domain-containing protein